MNGGKVSADFGSPSQSPRCAAVTGWEDMRASALSRSVRGGHDKSCVSANVGRLTWRG